MSIQKTFMIGYIIFAPALLVISACYGGWEDSVSSGSFLTVVHVCYDGFGNPNTRNIIYALAGIAALYGLWVRTRQLDVGNEQLEIAKKTQETDIITRAFEQLGNEAVAVRCSSVHLLQHIAEQNPENIKIITDILMSFVKAECQFKSDRHRQISLGNMDDLGELSDEERSLYVDPPIKGARADIEAALRTLGKIVPDNERRDIKFRELNFRYLQLHQADFRKFSFFETHLHQANLIGVNLQESNLHAVQTEWADFSYAELNQASLTYIKFKCADLTKAVFYKTDCSGSDFSDALPDSMSPVENPPPLEKSQIYGMIYRNGHRPTLPQNYFPSSIQKDGAYEWVNDGKTYRRQLITSDRWIDPPT